MECVGANAKGFGGIVMGREEVFYRGLSLMMES